MHPPGNRQDSDHAACGSRHARKGLPGTALLLANALAPTSAKGAPVDQPPRSVTWRSTRLSAYPSLNYFIRAQQEQLRDCETERLCRFEIDDEFEFGGLLDRQVGRLGALQDFVNVAGDNF